MKLTLKPTLLFILLCTFLTSFSQDKVTEMYKVLKEDMKAKELIIVLMEENDKVLNKLEKKTDELEYYKTVIKEYNSLIKELSPEYLSFFKGIQYKKVSELASISTEDRRNYYYLCYNIAQLQLEGKTLPFNVFNEIEANKEHEFLEPYKEMVLKKSFPWAKLEIYSYSEKKSSIIASSKSFINVNLPSVMPTKWGMVYALSNFQSMYDDEVTLTANSFKGKVLLLCSEDLDKKISANEIKKYYTNEYEVVSRDVYAKAIELKNPKYIYAITVPYMMSPTNSNSSGMTISSLMYSNSLIDCSTGRLVGLAVASFGVGPIGVANKEIDKGSLKQINKQLSKIIN